MRKIWDDCSMEIQTTTKNFKKLDVNEVESELEKIIALLNINDKISVAWLKNFTYNFDLPTNQINEKYFCMLFDLLPKDISEKKQRQSHEMF